MTESFKIIVTSIKWPLLTDIAGKKDNQKLF